MAVEGWISLHRKFASSDAWLAETFTRGQAWVDLLMLANFADGHLRIRGIKVDLQRGEIGHALRFYAKRWQWSIGKVKRFLNELETGSQIERPENNVTTLIVITNYDEYQGDGTQTGSQTEHRQTRKRNTDGFADGTNKKKKNKKNNEKKKNNNPGSALTASREDLQTATWMLGLLREINPSHRQPNLESWANTIRLMRERDGHEIGNIQWLFNWANKHDFWCSNIQSPAKLREKWDQLVVRAKIEDEKKHDPNGIKSAAEEYLNA